MKDEQINLKISPEEKSLLRKAAKNLNFETGAKENISEAIRHSVKKYAQTDLTKPECFLIDRDAIKAIDSNINLGLILLQKFLTGFKDLTGQNLNRDELENTFLGIGKLGSTAILESAIEELVKTKLLQQKKQKYPDLNITSENLAYTDLSNLYQIADDLNHLPEVKMQFVGIYWRVYSVNGNVISVILDQAEAIKDGYRFFANSSQELEKLSMVKSLCECLNNFLKDPEIPPDKLFSTVYFDKEARRFSPSGSYIKYSLQPRIFFEH